jgi:hypothetical protein
MQKIPSTGADASNSDIDQVIKQAKLARAQFILENPKRAWKAMGWNAMAAGALLLVAIGAGSGRNQAIENTATIERLATTLAQVPAIKPGTLHEISQLLARREYDCRQVGCEEWLQQRNAQARARLQAILAKHSSVAIVDVDR